MNGGILSRRRLLGLGAAGAGGAVLARIGLDGATALNQHVHRLLMGDALAREFSETAISRPFRANGNTGVPGPAYARLAAGQFADWRLEIDGLVHRPLALSMAEMRAFPQRSQVTRHDCVEGWSAIAKWQGPQLGPILARAGLLPAARYAVFHCADRFGDTPYYESIDLIDAFHPQTILAWRMNDAPLPVAHGAPLRLRVERQLGYKHAKYVMRIELRASLAGLYGGGGGYWEDRRAYQWYAGI